MRKDIYIMSKNRKLASIRKILEVYPIDNADKICCYKVGGWVVVDVIDKYKINDLVCYLEIDSWVPHELAPFLSKGHEPREFNGVKGERLRTIKLRGQISQGMILPLNVLNATSAVNISSGEYDAFISYPEEGTDVTEILGIQKWEAPVSAQLQGKVRGNFPSFIPKTDQERCQNLRKEISNAFLNGDEFEVSVKMDGSSMTVYHNSYPEDTGIDVQIVKQLGVCSRNLDLDLTQEGNSFVDTAKNSGLLVAIEKLGLNIAVQSELCGEGIQGNPEKIVGHKLFVFDIFNIDTQSYLTPTERYVVMKNLYDNGMNDKIVKHTEVLHKNFKLPTDNIGELLKLADGKNSVGNNREGLVYKRLDGKFSFKTISNNFLLQEA